MRKAIIDLGTNTFHLLIVEKIEKDFEILFKHTEAVKLGEGRINHNQIIHAAFNRGINALVHFKNVIDDFEVDEVKAVATSALRGAENKQDFIDLVKAKTFINIQLIDGDTEANLIYKGVKLGGAISDLSLIMDIGGGSVEFILCDTNEVFWKKSYDLGAARLMQQFLNSDPINDQDKQGILGKVNELLPNLFEVCEQHKPKTLIGSAGAFETFAALIKEKYQPILDVEDTKTYTFNFDQYIDITTQLITATHGERMKMPGMIPLRVDMSMIAALISNYVIGRLQIETVKLSTYDLKMGLVAEMLG
ncbi:exopolyphosphatase/guanosine-5'-triphosphate,3'-diphosphate pyrophosphatase [Pedobacter sp. UYP30]|uniref:Ppx/GppA phosphatase family protein n=1 Tax=Pedobacter sp. UYP30 TaxID=1756400 RepID=UPI003398198E